MNTTVLTHLTDSLAAVLEGLIALHEAMHSVIGGKLEAMRAGDVDGMLAGARHEAEIAEQVERLSGERIRIVATLAAALKLPVTPSAVSLRMLAARLIGEDRARLLGLASRLRERMVSVGEANRTVEFVCREMLVHFKTLFTCIVRGADSPATYQRDGEMGCQAGVQVLDALG